MLNSDNLADQKNRPWLKVHEELGVGDIPFDDRPMAVHIARHAKERPDAPALLFLDKVITFAEYDARTSKLANALRDLGVGKGDVIGLLMPNIPQYAFAIAACSRLGAIGTGLSPLGSPPEVAYQISDAQVKVVLALGDLAPLLTGMPQAPDCLTVVIVTEAADEIVPSSPDLPAIAGTRCVAYSDAMAQAADHCEQVPVHRNDTFMIQYTGGTTGRPKGAQLSVRNLMHNPALGKAMGTGVVEGEDVWASPFPMFHIAGVFTAVSCARYATLFFLCPDPRDLEAVIGMMKRFPPTIVAAVPALTEMLLAVPALKDVDFSNLKVWGSGAAPISTNTVEQLGHQIGTGKLGDSFGMTETSAGFIANPAKRYKFGSVGLPVPQCDVRIMDVEQRDVEMPLGEPGEICVSGPQVMKGYINLPEESGNALRDIDGTPYMYTGDVGYMDEEGYVFLCDRAKDMLIVGGFKVFSVEIEDKLSSLGLVEASAIVGKPDEARPGNDIVHLFVQLDEDHKARSESDLRAELMAFFADNMAIYKKPKVVQFIEAIPFTPIGKIDKKKLRAQL